MTSDHCRIPILQCAVQNICIVLVSPCLGASTTARGHGLIQVLAKAHHGNGRRVDNVVTCPPQCGARNAKAGIVSGRTLRRVFQQEGIATTNLVDSAERVDEQGSGLKVGVYHVDHEPFVGRNLGHKNGGVELLVDGS